MGYGRATATFVSSTAPSSSAARDDFLSRLASAESRDGGTPTGTGGAEERMLGTHAGEDPRYVKAHRTRAHAADGRSELTSSGAPLRDMTGCPEPEPPW